MNANKNPVADWSHYFGAPAERVNTRREQAEREGWLDAYGRRVAANSAHLAAECAAYESDSSDYEA